MPWPLRRFLGEGSAPTSLPPACPAQVPSLPTVQPAVKCAGCHVWALLINNLLALRIPQLYRFSGHVDVHCALVPSITPVAKETMSRSGGSNHVPLRTNIKAQRIRRPAKQALTSCFIWTISLVVGGCCKIISSSFLCIGRLCGSGNIVALRPTRVHSGNPPVSITKQRVNMM